MSEPLTLNVNSAIHGERTWRRVAIEPHINRHGVNVGLATWQSSCVVCGQFFTVKTPAHCGDPARSKSFHATT